MMEIIRLALEEDIGAGDITSRACIPDNLRARGIFLAREPLVLAGTEVLAEMYDSPRFLKRDGDECAAGDQFAEVEGPVRLLLERERVALNFLQRLSGVATLARQFADAIAGTNCRVLDTRKTTPGLRMLEKRAAAAGGVTNHRMGLFDAMLIKNNHIAAAGGVRAAIECMRGLNVPVEIEVRTRAELDEALDAGAQHLLLDNLTPAEAADWVREIDAPRHRRTLGRHHARDRPRLRRDRRRFRFRRAPSPTPRAPWISVFDASGMNVERLRQAFPARHSNTTRPSTPPCAPAAELALGSVVIADEQTAGQGRHGHSWHSEPGAGLYCLHRARTHAPAHAGAGPRHRRSDSFESPARLRPPLAQRPDARRKKVRRHPGATGRRPRHRAASASTSTTRASPMIWRTSPPVSASPPASGFPASLCSKKCSPASTPP